MFGFDAGILERKEQLLEASLEQWGSEQGSDCHVATSTRRDVSTSRRLHVATSPRRDVYTSRRLHVATSPRRDVSTSRRLHVATSPRRDVATSRRQLEICTLSFKVRMVQKSGYREVYERRHGIPELNRVTET